MTKYFIFDESTYELVNVVDSPDYPKTCNLVIPCAKDNQLATMLTIQDLFQKRLGTEYNTQYIMNHALYADAEIHEFLRELEGFKAWKKYDWNKEEREIHLSAAKEEFVDVLHFIFNIANAIGLTADEIFEIYLKKNEVNHIRQDNNY